MPQRFTFYVFCLQKLCPRKFFVMIGANFAFLRMASALPDLNQRNYITGVCVLLFVVFIINSISLLVGRIRNSDVHRPLRSGGFTIFFYFAVLLHVCIISVPITYLLFHIWKNSQWGLMLIAVGIHTMFWIISLYRLIKERHYHEYHILSIANYVISSIFVVVPLIFWRKLFPYG